MTDLLEMQKQYNLNEVDLQTLTEVTKLVPLEFNTDKKGNVCSKYQGQTVLIDNEHSGTISAGEMWVVKLKSGTSYYYAVPKFEVDSAFMAQVLYKDHCDKFIERIFDPKKGIKPKYLPALKEVMGEATLKLTEDLAATRKELDAVKDSTSRLEAQKKQAVDKLATKEKAFNEEKQKLKAQIDDLKKEYNVEGSKEDRRQIDALRQQVLDLKKDNASLQLQLEEAQGTNKSLKQSYEESLLKAKNDVQTANDQRDAVAKSKSQTVQELEDKIKNLEKQIAERSSDDKDKEQIENLNEMIDQLQAQLVNAKAENAQLLRDYTAVNAHGAVLEKKVAEMDKTIFDLNMKASTPDPNNDTGLEQTIAAMQTERKVLMEELQKAKDLNSALDSANDKLREEITQLTEKLESVGGVVDFTDSGPSAKVMVKPTFRVKRVGQDMIESDWFTEERYSVLTRGDGKQLLITPDENGHVACKDYVLEIYKLNSIVPFTKNKPLEVMMDPETNEILVTL